MTIKIKGTIIYNEYKWIYDALEIESTCPNDVLSQLEKVPIKEDIDIEINSAGGYIFAANEIYTALMQRQGNVNILITSLAASAASVIAMAGTNVTMSATAQMMIHNVWGGATGDYRDMDKASEDLQISNQAMAKSYQLKTGLSMEEILEIMDKETWYTAEQAKEKGFADNVLVRGKNSLVASAEANILAPELIQKMKKKQEVERLKLLELEGEEIL